MSSPWCQPTTARPAPNVSTNDAGPWTGKTYPFFVSFGTRLGSGRRTIGGTVVRGLPRRLLRLGRGARAVRPPCPRAASGGDRRGRGGAGGGGSRRGGRGLGVADEDLAPGRSPPWSAVRWMSSAVTKPRCPSRAAPCPRRARPRSPSRRAAPGRPLASTGTPPTTRPMTTEPAVEPVASPRVRGRGRAAGDRSIVTSPPKSAIDADLARRARDRGLSPASRRHARRHRARSRRSSRRSGTRTRRRTGRRPAARRPPACRRPRPRARRP